MKSTIQTTIFILALSALILLSCGDESTGPTTCVDCAAQTIDQAKASLEQTLFTLINSSDPQRPSDVDFSVPYGLFAQAYTEDSGNLDARFGLAVTGLLMLTVDADVNAAWDEWDAYLVRFE